MKIKNIGKVERRVSRDGKNVPLLPGAAMEAPLTAKEADAFRGLGFEVTGEPSDKKPTKAKD